MHDPNIDIIYESQCNISTKHRLGGICLCKKKMFRAVSPRFMQKTDIVGYHQWVFTVSSLVCFIDCLARQTNDIIWSDNNLILLRVSYEFTPAF